MRALILLVPLLLLGCTEPKKLDRESMNLSPTERQAVEESVRGAEKVKAWTSAWNQAVDGGLGRATLERVALGALEDRELDEATAMFNALRDKEGPLSAAARAKVGELSRAAGLQERWTVAAEIEIAAADVRSGEGSFPGAWRVYREAPPAEAPAVLELIDEARKEARENRDGD